MKDLIQELPGLEQVRNRFVSMLGPRKDQIAAHALGAWEADTLDAINTNLEGAQSILHQIAGTAGSLGFVELGENARACENDIVAHRKGPDADLAICPGELISRIDMFISDCDQLLENQSA